MVVSTSSRTTASFRILVVEDDERLQALYTRLLGLFGFKSVKSCVDAESALQELEESALPYDLVILDWDMPGAKNGMDVLSYIRRDYRRPYTAVLLATGMAQMRHVHEGRDSGMTDFLAKPFTVDQLKDKLVRMFKNPRAFIRTSWYAGPCRRRRNIGPPGGEDRRKAVAR